MVQQECSSVSPLRLRFFRLMSRSSSLVIVVITSLLSIICIALSCCYLYRVQTMESGSHYVRADYREMYDNIGYGDYSNNLTFPPMDVVYTWVNGSDPVWLKEKNYYKDLYNKERNITSEDSEDCATSDNRFRDNDELKYSLRSLEVNAPWIRKVYIVTNGQVPSWLDQSNPRVKVVSHEEIFYDKSALPTFSSPAIEFNIHHIESLSDYFIYFNDDVFLGSPVYPYDFMSLENGQYLFSSWMAPDCSKNCRYNQLGDGRCDYACNTELCGFDMGDCLQDNKTDYEFASSKDSYHDSLIHTNIELSRLFGTINRYVPAHMPHLLNKNVLKLIEQNMTSLVNETIHHRFRDSKDLQYAFLYFYYLHHYKLLHSKDLFVSLWKWIDSDDNNMISQTELQTLNLILFGENANEETMLKVLHCISSQIDEYSDVHYSLKRPDRLIEHHSFLPNITFESFKSCSIVANNIRTLIPSASPLKRVGDKDVAFQMIHDDLEDTRMQLDSVRKRKSKFICINDDLTSKSQEMERVIHDFYESFFPLPSQFEKNRRSLLLHRKWRQWLEAAKTNYFYKRSGAMLVILGVGLCGWIVWDDVKKSHRRSKQVQV